MIAPTPSTKWRIVTLDDVAAPVKNAIVDGPFGSNLKLVDYVPEGVPVLQGKNITDDTFRWFDVRFISSRKAEELKRSSVRIGDILIVKIGSIGYSAILDDLNGFDHAIIPANLAKVTPNLSKVDLRYLYRWLTSTAANDYLVRVASKTAQPALSLRKIKDLPVPLPPLAEQKRIAGILDAADALRAKRREALAQIDSLLQSTFLDMFGDPVINPMAWDERTLGELGQNGFRNGLSPSNQGTFDGEVLTLSAITRGRFDFAEKKSARFDHPPAPSQKLRTDTFLICRGNGNRRLVGAGAYPDRSSTRVCFPDTMIGVVINPRIVVAAYFQHVWRTHRIRRQIERGARTTNGTHKVNQRLLSSIVFPVPPMDLQIRFAAIVESVDQQKAKQRAHLTELDTLFASLQSRAFRGDL